ncbi:MAG: CDP-alcohol phosphatidyltransferase family protein, partial [Leptospiraceae bacterium]|nr:CDP-alcohol phosphatidyltransferase family protein [Leptospiraceae bacterium]
MPLLWYTMQLEDFDLSNKYSIGILMFMILTDYLDGLLARKLGQETPLGQYLDPVADKFAIVGG